MARNPMQRKAQNSFLLGMLITLLITGIIIAFLVLQLTKLQSANKKEQNNKVDICVINKDIKSGQVITKEMVETIKVDKNTIPSNAFGDEVNKIKNYELEDTKGNSLKVDKDGNLCAVSYNEKGEAITNRSGEIEYKIIETTNGVDYYYQDSGEKIELKRAPIIAKIDIEKNTVLTSSLIVRSNEKITNDIRKVEYNMILLPSQLATGEYIDIRLRLPNGADYIVVSHKQVDIPQISGVESLTTISLNLSELEILTLNAATVEAYRMEGAKLYAVQYVEPGLQEDATTTYVPSVTILRLIQTDKNCVEEARQGLWNELYEEKNGETVQKESTINNRQLIDNAINSNAENGKEDLKNKVEQEIQTIQEERQKYLESLGGTN